MIVNTQEILVQGIPISRGIAIGIPYFFTQIEDSINEIFIANDALENEILRYRRALKLSKKDIKQLHKQMKKEYASEAAAILEAHLHMLDDPLLTLNIEKEITKSGKNAEFIFFHYVKNCKKQFEEMNDPFFRERGKDLQEVARRILGYLCEEKYASSLMRAPKNSIVFTHEIASSDVAETHPDCVLGFVTESGGATSHAAIIAKAKGIPYVANVNLSEINQGQIEKVIIDGRTGDIVLNPNPETLTRYQLLQRQLLAHFQILEKASFLESETYDGYKVRLSANIEMINELEMLHQYGGSGVGLFRSEYMFLDKQSFPSEEEQFFIYKRIVEQMRGLPIVIRTFDVGGDKLMLQQRHTVQEGNPYLGIRAIRFLLKEREIFKTQLRAILRASHYGDVSIMFPMISGLPELLEAKQLIVEAQQELEASGKKMVHKIRIGCMIEVPSAAIIADLLAKECDFLSIGTNDLVQYCVAAERGNPAMSGLYTPTHPSVIRLMKLVVTQANQYSIPVTVCGEVAGDPRFTSLLLGIGIHELSVASRYLPIVKNAIRNTSILEACELAEKILTLTTSAEIQEILTQEYQKNVPQDFFYNF